MKAHDVGTKRQTTLRGLPSIDKLLRSPQGALLIEKYGHSLTVEAFRSELATQRKAVAAGRGNGFETESLIQAASSWLEELFVSDLRPVINATGIVVHTNLGRAPLSSNALAAALEASASYSSLEYDLSTGRRGTRAEHVERMLKHLTGAEASMVVNNNAAAVLLMLTALCRGKRVIISRGQLVEIGGGFRIPDVMAQSGAELVEVGTTNRTHLRDYESAIDQNTGAIFVAHHSNYRIVGFTSEPTLAELAPLARKYELPLLYDQGSGALLDVAQFGFHPEPTVQEGLGAGCDLVAFSGDKLLGGPQAGILCGKASLVAEMKKHPLARAMRSDKICLAALGATLKPFLAGATIEEIPVWRMISRSLDDIFAVADAWESQLQANGLPARAIEGESLIGGGSLPGTSIPTKLLAIEHGQVDLLAELLRADRMPVIARVQGGQLLLDPRTVLPGQGDELLASVVRNWQTMSTTRA